jgi:LmbE family N-acetylglucosaminyl deacetylase
MALMMQDARILVLAPHTDDGELGAGASISRWRRDGNRVDYVAFSACETIQPPDRDPAILRFECKAALSALDVREDHVQILDFSVRHFDKERQRLLDVMVTLSESLKPDLVVLPSSDDTHQDHSVVLAEARRAFKRTRMMGYEVPWNNFRFESTAFVGVEPVDVSAKMVALDCFTSQASRPYMSREYVESQLRFRGVQAGREYAEAFQILRWYV